MRFKTRLIAEGCREVEGVDSDPTFAPVSTHSCRRVAMNLAVTKRYEIYQIDIKTAFRDGELDFV